MLLKSLPINTEITLEYNISDKHLLSEIIRDVLLQIRMFRCLIDSQSLQRNA